MITDKLSASVVQSERDNILDRINDNRLVSTMIEVTFQQVFSDVENVYLLNRITYYRVFRSVGCYNETHTTRSTMLTHTVDCDCADFSDGM